MTEDKCFGLAKIISQGKAILGRSAGWIAVNATRTVAIMDGDGASDASRAHSAGDTSPFSGADHDAAIMADAFRTSLHKPGFAGPPLRRPRTTGMMRS